LPGIVGDRDLNRRRKGKKGGNVHSLKKKERGTKMEIRPNLYRKAAFLYDFDHREIVKDDIPFYLEYAAKYPREILDVVKNDTKDDEAK